MESESEPVEEYTDEILLRADLLWGEGFLSPGGPAEVAAIVAGETLDGREVLDIGSGPGGVSMLLATAHGAARIVGVDVERVMVERARQSAAATGLEDRVEFRLVAPGPLPLETERFHVVFSKDSINHVDDKAALFSEILRVLRPGGRLLMSDWLRGANPDASAVERLYELLGLTVNLDTATERREALERCGLRSVRSTDRTAHIAAILEADCVRLRGELKAEVVDLVGEERHRAWQAIRDAMAAAMTTRAMEVHVFRAEKGR